MELYHRPQKPYGWQSYRWPPDKEDPRTIEMFLACNSSERRRNPIIFKQQSHNFSSYTAHFSYSFVYFYCILQQKSSPPQYPPFTYAPLTTTESISYKKSLHPLHLYFLFHTLPRGASYRGRLCTDGREIRRCSHLEERTGRKGVQTG